MIPFKITAENKSDNLFCVTPYRFQGEMSSLLMNLPGQTEEELVEAGPHLRLGQNQHAAREKGQALRIRIRLTFDAQPGSRNLRSILLQLQI